MPQIPGAIQPLLGRFGMPLFYIGSTAVTPASVLSFVIIITLAFAVSWVVQGTLRKVYLRNAVDEGVQYALNRLLHYAILALGIFVALDNLGISVTGLAAIGAIVGVGIGFGLQNIAQNFVSGLILLLERPVKKGDFVEVGNVRGTVREIRARATLVTTLDNVDVVVPNGQLIAEPVTNSTLRDRTVRIHVKVGVAYGSDTNGVRAALQKVAAEHPAVLATPPTTVRFLDFGESSLDFSLLCWIADPLGEPETASDLRFAIDRVFREQGIHIPFPQRDLHLRSGWPAPATGAPE